MSLPTPTIRLRLTLWFGAAAALLLVAYGVFSYEFTRRALLRELDRQLRFDFEILEDYVTVDASGAPQMRPFSHNLNRVLGIQSYWWEVWSEDGRLLLRNEPLSEQEVRTHLPLAPGAERVFASTALADGLHVRTLQKAHRVGAVTLLLRVVRSEEEVRRALAELREVADIALPLGLATAALGGYWLAGRLLRPVRDVTEQARRITATSLGARISVAHPADEIGRLAAVMNETLARLERSFEELRRFTADASHEFRTPLNAIRTTGQAVLRDEATPEELRAALGSILEEEARLAALTEALLTLARGDAGTHELRREPCDLAAIARETCERYAVLAGEKHAPLAVRATEPVVVAADRTLLRQALANLVDNAIKYGAPGRAIDVCARHDGAWGTFEIANTGPAIPPEQREKIFDRFFRSDASRAAGGRGFGLGLAIVQWIASAHGGSVSIASVPERPTVFSFRLPLA